MIITCQHCGANKYARPSDHRKYCSERCAHDARYGVKTRRLPILLFCKRPGCEGYREVKRPYLQRRGGYCSRRCAALVNQNYRKADHRAAGLKSAAIRRRYTVELVANLTPWEAFKVGYQRGLQAKWRVLRLRYTVTRKTA